MFQNILNFIFVLLLQFKIYITTLLQKYVYDFVFLNPNLAGRSGLGRGLGMGHRWRSRVPSGPSLKRFHHVFFQFFFFF